MASVASQLIQELTAHAQSDSLEDARQICADGTYFPNNLRTHYHVGCNVHKKNTFYVIHVSALNNNYIIQHQQNAHYYYI